MKSFNEIFWQLHANVPHSTHLEYIASFLFKNTITDIKKIVFYWNHYFLL